MNYKYEWDKLKKAGYFGSFSFNGIISEWRTSVAAHFKTSNLQPPCYGIYVVSQKSTGKIIYVGKSGTVCQDGSFKDQDLQLRLVNNEKGRPRKEVFAERVVVYGELLIEYVVQKSQAMIPAYLEARLLQAYFDDNGKLPPDNAAL